MKKRQAYNPYLPLDEYIPDAEPHVFGDRVYVFGSHDREGGYTFCMEDYVVYSAPVDDLKNWRLEGVSYRASQDPGYPRCRYLFAPDVTRGNDGKYYLYYCMGDEYGQKGYTNPVSVAVSDSPAGPYEFLGYVSYSDGSPCMDYVCFDPAVINDDGVIRLYYGTQYDYEEKHDIRVERKYLETECEMFGRSEEEILSHLPEDSIMGAVMLTLEDDMVTVKERPRHIIPWRVQGTGFEEHPFFEGSSIRKAGDRYYFIYSSWLNHELCYAVSQSPDRDFTFGGTIVSNADIGYRGRTEKYKLNMTGTTHGSIECINGQWYVFYHRLTHKSDYSRQDCAEPITIMPDGSIPQVEITSCGLNGGPLSTPGNYPAVIACNITDGHMPWGSNSIYTRPFPNVTSIGSEHFIGEIGETTLIGFKYFDFQHVTKISVTARIETDENRVVYRGPVREDDRGAESDEDSDDACGLLNPGEPGDEPRFEVRISEDGESLGDIYLKDSSSWALSEVTVPAIDGVHPLYLVYHGRMRVQLLSIYLG